MVKIMNISTEPKLSSRIQTQGWYRLLEWSRHPNHCAWTCDSRSSLSGLANIITRDLTITKAFQSEPRPRPPSTPREVKFLDRR
jgi:hypothetical protein